MMDSKNVNSTRIVRFSEGGKYLTAVYDSGLIKVWQMHDFTLLQQFTMLQGEQIPVECLVFQQDNLIAIGDLGGNFAIWDITKQKLLFHSEAGAGTSILDIRIVSKDIVLVITSSDLLIINYNTGIYRRLKIGGRAELLCGRFKNDFVALVGDEVGNISVIDLRNNTVKRLSITDESIGQIEPLKNGKETLIWSGGIIVIRNIKNGELIKVLHEDTGESSIAEIGALSKSQKLVASVGFNKYIVLIQIKSGKIIGKLSEFDEEAQKTPHVFMEISTLDFSPDDIHLASGTYDGKVELWDVASRKKIHEF